MLLDVREELVLLHEDLAALLLLALEALLGSGRRRLFLHLGVLYLLEVTTATDTVHAIKTGGHDGVDAAVLVEGIRDQ